METDPYVRLSKRELYRNPWLAVETHEIVHPNGTPGEHVLVVAPAPCAVVVEDGETLLFTRQPRFGAQRMVVEIVKGGREGDESALECAARELREELGVEARHWTPLGRLYEIPSIVSDPIDVFLASDTTPARGEQEAVESIEALRLSFERAIACVRDGEIDDAITVAALFRYALARGLMVAASSPRSSDIRAPRARD
ncbi:MAG TPA: NUDIX hydrolase [Candidatus Acidoferrales bacterium]|jgi:ADP-ribose pyrophosphatase|nr:NUDIX hydrolase [Candidatus Acidoferrales bacterium]